MQTDRTIERNRLRLLRRAALRRCYDKSDPDYHRYGGRGITMCKEWRDRPTAFVDWAQDNGARRGLYLDRIDSDGPYSPENCRFVTPRESSRNCCHVLRYTYKGTTRPLIEWAERYGLKYETVRRRYKSGVRGAKLFAPPENPQGAHYYEAFGRRRTLREWGEVTGLGYEALKYRICRAGWPIERALTTPKAGT